MNIFKRLKNRKHKKDKIKAYYKGCNDTNKVRDEKDKNKEKIFNKEIQKKDEIIYKLRNLLYKNDEKNNEMKKDLMHLKEELLMIENFVERKQIKANTDAIRKLSTIQEANKMVARLEKRLPGTKSQSEKSVVDAEVKGE